MKIVAVVPMKLNNKRLPQKNTKSFTYGKPLCSYILDTLIDIEEIDKTYVYCSDSTIQKYLPNNINFLRRNSNLDSDSTSMNEVLLSFANEVSADIYLMTHTTSPFVTQQSIKKGINAVKSGKYDSAFAAVRVQDFLWKEGAPMNYDLKNIPRTQDLPLIMKETSGFYIYKNEVIKELNRRIGNKPYIVEVNEIEAIDIDEPEDFLIADAVYTYLKNNNHSR